MSEFCGSAAAGQGGRDARDANATGSSCRPSRTAGGDRGGAVQLTGASEATIRRDIATLHMQKKLRRVRGGAEAIAPPQFVGLAGRPFAVNQTLHIAPEARHRPRRGGAVRGRRSDHHQRRHHDLPDGASAGRPGAAGLHQLVPDRRAPAEAFQEHGACCRAARSTASRTSSCRPFDNDVIAQFLRPADVHGRPGHRPARADGGATRC